MAKRTHSAPKTFEEALQELEQILADIEGGELGLEDSLAKYERGNFLIHHCRGVLNTAERQIELLSRGPDGSLQSEPMGQFQDAGQAQDARQARDAGQPQDAGQAREEG